MSLFEDSAQRLWVGTYGGGLVAVRSRHAARSVATPRIRRTLRTLSSGRVTALAEDTTGLLWVGTDGGGLNALDRGRTARCSASDTTRTQSASR